MMTKSNAKGAARRAGNVYVEVEFAPGHVVFVQAIKSDLWRALEDYPNGGEISGVIDANGDVWIGPRFADGEGNVSPRGNGRDMEAVFNRLERLESMFTGAGEATEEAPRPAPRKTKTHGRGPVMERGPATED